VEIRDKIQMERNVLSLAHEAVVVGEVIPAAKIALPIRPTTTTLNQELR
jgi:hypothetical protein